MPLAFDMTLQIKIYIMDAMECPLPFDMTLQMEIFIRDIVECPPVYIRCTHDRR